MFSFHQTKHGQELLNLFLLLFSLVKNIRKVKKISLDLLKPWQTTGGTVVPGIMIPFELSKFMAGNIASSASSSSLVVEQLLEAAR